MYTIDLKELFPYVALIISILSPIITAHINNRHKIKMYNIEFYNLHRAEVIEDYIHSVGILLKDDNFETLEQYYQCLGEVYLYLPENLWNMVDRIDVFIRVEKNRVFALNIFKDLCKALSKEPPRFIY